ncbi:unnamed protein product [Caenorhabditis bovis]|uniref:F-box domain-containing protein n=1 Tax=Caenorhabditis bovis TaxID=2654633 RepID=A0A8S1ES21_9PELO|nr:unnamed protein product [Caenorhabditis bovis]
MPSDNATLKRKHSPQRVFPFLALPRLAQEKVVSLMDVRAREFFSVCSRYAQELERTSTLQLDTLEFTDHESWRCIPPESNEVTVYGIHISPSTHKKVYRTSIYRKFGENHTKVNGPYGNGKEMVLENTDFYERGLSMLHKILKQINYRVRRFVVRVDRWNVDHIPLHKLDGCKSIHLDFSSIDQLKSILKVVSEETKDITLV